MATIFGIYRSAEQDGARIQIEDILRDVREER